ncbi:MAG: TRAP transporter permease [Sedimentisphaerales bacterium]|nr:TRAP transporter permease [Sedimentisphaerales bacterium]
MILENNEKSDQPCRRQHGSTERFIISTISIAWALFQLALPRLIILDSTTVRAIHLAFAITLVFLTCRFRAKQNRRTDFSGEISRIPFVDYVLAFLACLSVLYFVFDWTGITMRAGLPIRRDIVMSVLLIVLLLEATRRAIGPALTIIAILFTLYAFLGSYMPSVFAFRGVSLRRYLSQIALSTEGIYGIPLYVSANTVFLFVLLGSMLDKVGAGHFFNDLAISLLGRFKGGAAKAAIVSSGLTGLVSGSSIANVVTTGTFTIPLMKKCGYPGKIAAATEVAASTNGQLMPPIMGAAAFIIAEYLGIDYLDVVKAAVVPALVSYFALFYIAHLEASKLGMKGLPKSDIPIFMTVLKNGFHYLIPLFVLIYELIIMRHSPNLAAFNAILILMAITFIQEIIKALKNGTAVTKAAIKSVRTISKGLVAGSRNMLTVALATATAGIIVGIVFMGISGMVVGIVAQLSFGYIFPLLLITAVASLILGMGLPTTATYIVMASITVPVIRELSPVNGVGFILIPPIAAHLFCFYFGILADDTPPVGLAAYAAAAIAKSDPIATGIQGFIYDLRTAVIPFMFVFNAELVLHQVNNWPQALLIFIMAIFGAFAFTNALQGWFVTKNKWYEIPLFLIASLILFWPAIVTKIFNLDYSFRYYMYIGGIAIYGLSYLIQKRRLKALEGQGGHYSKSSS